MIELAKNTVIDWKFILRSATLVKKLAVILTIDLSLRTEICYSSCNLKI